MLPLIAFVVPCFNSAAYMRTALNSILEGAGNDFHDRIEILVVNDGSTDSTAQIAQEYVDAHPGVVQLISQDNGGHGAAVMAGVHAATAVYVKVLDSDDRLQPSALKELLGTTARFPADALPDILITDYVYDNAELHHQRRIDYRGFVSPRRTLDWDHVRRPRTGCYFLMHALTYKRAVLIESGLQLPRHTFYVDNIYASVPLRHTRTLFYLPVPLYMYFIGREDQSVNEKVMIKRVDQQLRVNRIMINELRVDDVASPGLTRYLLHYLTIITSVSLTFCTLAGTEEARRKGRHLLAYLRENNPRGYRAYRRSPMSLALSVRGPGSHRFIRTTYRVVRKRFGFN